MRDSLFCPGCCWRARVVPAPGWGGACIRIYAGTQCLPPCPALSAASRPAPSFRPLPQGAACGSFQAARRAVRPAPSGFTAAGGLSQALAALEGGMSELPPFSLLLPLEGGPAGAVEAGEEAEQAAAMAALDCGAAAGADDERQRQLMPPPPPRPAPARQPQPAAPTREQLAAAALAVAEAEGLASLAGWGETGDSGLQEGMADSFSGLPAPSLPPELPAGLPAEQQGGGGGRRSSRRAAQAVTSRPPCVQMRQVGLSPCWEGHAREAAGADGWLWLVGLVGRRGIELSALLGTSIFSHARAPAANPPPVLPLPAGGRRGRQPHGQPHPRAARPLPQAPRRNARRARRRHRLWQPV